MILNEFFFGTRKAAVADDVVARLDGLSGTRASHGEGHGFGEAD
jgi:hypothetical protein